MSEQVGDIARRHAEISRVEDQNLDIAVTNAWGGYVSILLGIGNGSFSPTIHYSDGYWPMFIATEDFDGDSYYDLVTANVHGQVSVLLGNGDGSFGSSVQYAAGGGRL